MGYHPHCIWRAVSRPTPQTSTGVLTTPESIAWERSAGCGRARARDKQPAQLSRCTISCSSRFSRLTTSFGACPTLPLIGIAADPPRTRVRWRQHATGGKG